MNIPSYTLPTANRRVLLTSRPTGIPAAGDFAIDTAAVPAAGPGQMLVRNLYLSVDPAQRGWAQVSVNYSEPVPLGTPMRALAVGVVIDSNTPDYRVGEFLYGFFGWQDYCVAEPTSVIATVDPELAPISAGAGLFGINGLTAYLALTQAGRPEAGETLLVSTAAGAVGSLVGQIGRILGCRTIGITGSAEKVARCTDRFGYSAAISYHEDDLRGAIAAAAPDGVDVYFDNTGGAILDAAIQNLRARGRIVQCGTASIATWSPAPVGPRPERDILTRELSWQGFVIFNHRERFSAAARQLGAWLRDGLLVYDEDISDDFTALPGSIADVYLGRNTGKRLVYVG